MGARALRLDELADPGPPLRTTWRTRPIQWRGRCDPGGMQVLENSGAEGAYAREMMQDVASVQQGFPAGELAGFLMEHRWSRHGEAANPSRVERVLR